MSWEVGLQAGGGTASCTVHWRPSTMQCWRARLPADDRPGVADERPPMSPVTPLQPELAELFGGRGAV